MLTYTMMAPAALALTSVSPSRSKGTKDTIAPTLTALFFPSSGKLE